MNSTTRLLDEVRRRLEEQHQAWTSAKTVLENLDDNAQLVVPEHLLEEIDEVCAGVSVSSASSRVQPTEKPEPGGAFFGIRV